MLNGASLPIWLTFSGQTFTFGATTNTLKGVYQLKVVGSFYSSNTLKTYSDSNTLQLTILPENKNPPSIAAPKD